jgi:phosphoribosyl 1,2-cyclic phosphodiesterase
VRVTVLSSGSDGNAIAITSADTTVLVDAGLAARTLLKRAIEAGVDLSRVRAVILTHEHGDHSRGAALLARQAGCAVYGSAGTLTALRAELADTTTVAVQQLRPMAIGPLTLTACRTTHDAAEPLALAVSGPNPGERVGLAYDFGRPTAALRYLLRESACLIIEANHDEIMLRMGPYPPVVRRRIAGTTGHLSNRAAAELVAELWHEGLKTVVLAHVSASCNRPELAEATVRQALADRGFTGALLVARRDTPLEPFDIGTAPDLITEEGAAV